MTRLALLSSVSPSRLSTELEAWGYEVFEALSLSEILHICEHQNPAAVIVSAGVEVFGLKDLAQHQIVLEQYEGCTTEQLVHTLTLMFGHNASKQ